MKAFKFVFSPPMLESFQNPIWATWAYIHLYTVPTASPSEGYLAHLGFYTTYVGIFSKPYLGQLGLYTFYTTCVKNFFKTLSGPIGPIYILYHLCLNFFQNPIWANWAYIHFYTVATTNPSEGYLAHLGFYTTCVGNFSKPSLGQLGQYTFLYSRNNQPFWRLFGPIWILYHLCWNFFNLNLGLFGPIGWPMRVVTHVQVIQVIGKIWMTWLTWNFMPLNC